MKKKDILKICLVLIAVFCIGSGWMKNAVKIDLEKLIRESVYFVDEVQGKEIKYTWFKSTNMDMYYVVLPSMYENMDIDFKIYYNDKLYRMYIDEMLYKSGQDWNHLAGEMVYDVKVVDVWNRVCMETPLCT